MLKHNKLIVSILLVPAILALGITSSNSISSNNASARHTHISRRYHKRSHIRKWNKYLINNTKKLNPYQNQAKHVYEYEIHKYHRNYRKTVNYDKKQIKQLNNSQVIHPNLVGKPYNNSFAKSTRSSLIHKLNNDRINNEAVPLTVSNKAQEIANQRIQHIAYAYKHTTNAPDYLIHGLSGKDSANVYSMLDGSTNLFIGENAGDISNGQDASYEGALDIKYNTTTPSGTAHAYEDNMMNHDGINDNGHRENILNRYYNHIGVATYNDGNMSYVAEVFTE